MFIGHVSLAQISGVVYRDFNANGTRETPGELGVGGITITVTGANGVVNTATSSTVATSASLGTYSITPTGTAPFRVQFSNIPSGFYTGPRGTGSGTTVQYTTTGIASINLGINHPADYVQANPFLITACYVNGDPLGGGTAGTGDAIVAVPYSATGNSPTETYYAFAREVGAVWGLAYQRSTSKLFSASFIKRHVGLAAGGSGAVYVTTPGSGTFTTAVHANLDNLGFDTGTIPSRSLPASRSTANRDASAIFDMVGKAGLGDLDISDDGTQLYTINLFDRKLYRIPATGTPTAANIASFSVASATSACRTGSTFRPFAVKYYRDMVYVGGVCTNESVAGTTTFTASSGVTSITVPDTTGLKAVVLQFNPTNSTFTSVLSFPLTYKKGADNADKTGVDRAEYWYPWNATFDKFVRNDDSQSYPQPWLTDIEFDTDGSMIVGVRDRFGEQYGNSNLGPNTAVNTLYRAIAPGDILRAGKCGTGDQWTLENNGRICGVSATTLTTGNGQGPGGREYYYGDQVALAANHAESSLGGLALWPGSDEIAYTAMDPTDVFNTGGMKRLQNSTGGKVNGVQIYSDTGSPEFFGKGNGLGDLELMSNPAPIEIGNRIWLDSGTNGTSDGLQGTTGATDGIGGLTVSLYEGAALVGTTTSASGTGEYYFNSTNVTGGLKPNTAYQIRIAMNQAALSGLTPALADQGSDDTIDSDGITSGSNTVINLTTGDYGQNNHTYDFGFVACPTITSAVASQSTVCSGTTVNMIRVTTTATGTNAVRFVYFTSAQSGTAVYSGGTTLATATPASGSATITNVSFPANTGTSSITYYVYARLDVIPNSAECFPSAGTTVVVNPNPVPTATNNGPITCSQPNATVSATSSIASSTFRWAGPASFSSTAASFATSVAGTYSVTVTAPTGCSATTSTSVVQNTTPPQNVAAANNGPITCAQPTAAVSVTTSTAGVTYLWSGPGNFNSTAQSFTTATAGTYSVTVTSTANGCFTVVSTSLGQDISAPVASATGGQIGCQATSIQLAASSTPSGVTYRWTGPNSFTSALQAPTVSTVGTYTVTVTSMVNGCVGTDTAIVSKQACASLGNLVFEDTNGNGLQDVGEPGINGVTVQLYLNGSATPVASATTISGLYSFTGLTPGPSFSYVVGFGMPTGYTATMADQGANDAIDSDASAATGRTGSYTLAAGENNQTVDAGFYRTASLGNVVFADANRNGLQDGGEVGISGVTVQLFTATNTLVASTTTSADGLYSFTGLTPGVSYSVTFGTPTGYSATLADQGANDAVDSDANPATGRTGSYTLASNETNNTVDAGFFCVSPSVSATGGLLTCTSPAIQLQATSSLTPSTYQWTGPNSYTSSLQNPTVNTPGTYTVLVTSNAGCSATASATALVTQDVTPPQALSLTSSGLLSCTATTVTLTASSSTNGLSYAFAGPGVVSSSGATATVSQTGTYTVTATGANGCTATATTTVSQTLTSATVVQGTCNGNNTNSTTSDDYYTLSVSATPGVSGSSNRFEVLLNGVVLNPGGTPYGQSVTVGSPTTFKADGVTTYTLIIRDIDIHTCQTTRTTTAVASCSTCDSVLCPKVTVLKR